MYLQKNNIVEVHSTGKCISICVNSIKTIHDEYMVVFFFAGKGTIKLSVQSTEKDSAHFVLDGVSSEIELPSI